jgi:hypothetical protein
MTVKNVNLLWKSFKGIRKLNSINSELELGADIAHGIRLSKEKSGQFRSIRSSGWFQDFITMSEPVFRLFTANFSGYSPSGEELVAFTKTDSNINVWLVTDSSETLNPIQIAEFPLVADITDVCMAQWGDRLGMVIAFDASYLGFVYYSADAVIGGTQMGTTGFYYQTINLQSAGTSTPLDKVSRVCPYRSRLAVNGVTTYATGGQAREAIYGVWFSEAGNLLNFSMDPITSASETSAFYVETGEYVEQLEEYHGLTAFCQNRSYNITGSSQTDIRVLPLTAKGVIGNATFTLNGQCGYVDSYSHNIFTLRDNIDGTIGFNDPIGDDIQDYLTDVKDVTVNACGRRVRLLKSNGQSLVYDVDVGEWTEESFNPKARAVTFLEKEYFCDGSIEISIIISEWVANAKQTPDENGFYSHYRTNLIWLDSQSSIKSHLYPFAIILEPNTSNNFFVTFTTDRGDSVSGQVNKAGYSTVATYSANDNVPENGSMFVNDDDDLNGHVFFSLSGTELLVTVERPPFWRYLQIDIYTTSPAQQFNISGIEAKNTVISDEFLDY